MGSEFKHSLVETTSSTFTFSATQITLELSPRPLLFSQSTGSVVSLQTILYNNAIINET